PQLCAILYFTCTCPHRDLPSFPTRRSSDLKDLLARDRLRDVPVRVQHHVLHGVAEYRSRLICVLLTDHDAHRKRLPVSLKRMQLDRKSTRLNSSHVKISYAVFCLKKKKIIM